MRKKPRREIYLSRSDEDEEEEEEDFGKKAYLKLHVQ
jgi:hypothetical protein